MSLACVYKTAVAMSTHDALLERIQSLELALADKDASLSKKDERIADLERNIHVLTRLLQSKSEKRPAPEKVEEGQLWLAEILESAIRGTEDASPDVTTRLEEKPERKPRKEGRRSKFPDHLPVLRTTFDVPASDRVCKCGSELSPMGEDVTKELERVEFTLVHEIARKKYCCRECQEGVMTASGPNRVIDKGMLGVGFLAHVLTERFLNHMPYHRQEKKYGSEGLALSRSVLCTSTNTCAQLLQPITEQLRREIMSSDIVHTDDSPVTMLRGEGPGSTTARLWVYRDLKGRSYFDFTKSRRREGPAKMLDGFTGYIVADAYPGYDAFFAPDGATEVACWAHARRKYVTAETSEPKLAAEAIRRIGELYAIEKMAKDMPPGERGALRIRESKPRLDALRAWFAQTRPKLLDKGALAQAMDYTLSNWDALNRYIEDGRLPIDNNAAERAIRGVALGRKNWMFVGSEGGGQTAAAMFSLVETCKAAGVNVREYFRDVLLRISTCSDVAKLTPHG